MKYSINYLEDVGVVEVKSLGKPTFKEFTKKSIEAVELAQEKNTKLFLADDSQLEAPLNVEEIFAFPDLWERIGSSREDRLAVVVSEDESMRPDFKYFEIVCLENDWNVRIFDNREDAFEWLMAQKQAVLKS